MMVLLVQHRRGAERIAPQRDLIAGGAIVIDAYMRGRLVDVAEYVGQRADLAQLVTQRIEPLAEPETALPLEHGHVSLHDASNSIRKKRNTTITMIANTTTHRWKVTMSPALQDRNQAWLHQISLALDG